MICRTCHGRHGYWVGKEDGRRVYLPRAGAVVWRECPECIAGIQRAAYDGAVDGPDEITNTGETHE